MTGRTTRQGARTNPAHSMPAPAPTVAADTTIRQSDEQVKTTQEVKESKRSTVSSRTGNDNGGEVAPKPGPRKRKNIAADSSNEGDDGAEGAASKPAPPKKRKNAPAAEKALTVSSNTAQTAKAARKAPRLPAAPGTPQHRAQPTAASKAKKGKMSKRDRARLEQLDIDGAAETLLAEADTRTAMPTATVDRLSDIEMESSGEHLLKDVLDISSASEDDGDDGGDGLSNIKARPTYDQIEAELLALREAVAQGKAGKERTHAKPRLQQATGLVDDWLDENATGPAHGSRGKVDVLTIGGLGDSDAEGTMPRDAYRDTAKGKKPIHNFKDDRARRNELVTIVESDKDGYTSGGDESESPGSPPAPLYSRPRAATSSLPSAASQTQQRAGFVQRGLLPPPSARTTSSYSSRPSTTSCEPSTQSSTRGVSRAGSVQPHSRVGSVQPHSRPGSVQPRSRASSAQPRSRASSVQPSQVRIKREDGGNAKPASQQKSKPVKKDDLPDFVHKDWCTVFLPTLYHNFFLSPQPFELFTKGHKDFIKFVQNILDDVYPDIEYNLTASDSIMELAYKRINEKRSLIAAEAVDAVQLHLETFKTHQEQSEWIRWAKRADGPLYFGTPAPADGPLDRNDPSYVAPRGRLQSTFIINVATTLLRSSKGSITDANVPPLGLFGLIMAALERAACLQASGKGPAKSKRNTPASNDRQTLRDAGDTFSYENWGAKVESYVGGLSYIADERWADLMRTCKSKHSASRADDFLDGNAAETSFMDAYRGSIYQMDSP